MKLDNNHKCSAINGTELNKAKGDSNEGLRGTHGVNDIPDIHLYLHKIASSCEKLMSMVFS